MRPDHLETKDTSSLLVRSSSPPSSSTSLSYASFAWLKETQHLNANYIQDALLSSQGETGTFIIGNHMVAMIEGMNGSGRTLLPLAYWRALPKDISPESPRDATRNEMNGCLCCCCCAHTTKRLYLTEEKEEGREIREGWYWIMA